jgi:DNA modification methylase
MFNLFNEDNMKFMTDYKFDLIYADMIYEDENLNWIDKFWGLLKNNGVYIVQTDWHTNYLVRRKFESIKIGLPEDPIFINHLVWKNEWGNHPKRQMHQCYDDIIIYAKGKNYKFYPERIQVDKVTKNKRLNPSGRETKQATAWIDDICLTTTSKERIKKYDGHLIKWQKPLRLFDRIVAPFTDKNDLVFDPFMGSGSLGEWCIKNGRNYFGIEYDKEIFELAENRLKNIPISLDIGFDGFVSVVEDRWLSNGKLHSDTVCGLIELEV